MNRQVETIQREKRLPNQSLFFIVMFIVASFLLPACSEDDTEEPRLEISKNQVSLTENGKDTILISSNTMWTIDSELSSWLTFSSMSGKGEKMIVVSAVEGQTESKEGVFFVKTIDFSISWSIDVSLDVSQRAMSDETFTVNGVSFKMIGVKGGRFQMGATEEQRGDAYSNEKPVHTVVLSSYSIGQTEVTQELWETVMGSNPSYFKGAKRPVENVSWDDCQEFITKLNQLTGKKFRLPTEAEWEYAARGGNKSKEFKYAGSNTITDVAFYNGNSNNKGSESLDYGTHNVSTKTANELNVYDMSGNVHEWCYDWYGSYSSDSRANPTGATTGSSRVHRGGSWASNATSCRTSYRDYSSPKIRYDYVGFRLAQ